MKVWKIDYDDFSSGVPRPAIYLLAQAETFEDALTIFKNRLKEINQENSIITSLQRVGDAAGLEMKI